MDARTDDRTDDGPAPGPLRAAALIVLLEALALLGVAGFLVVNTIVGSPSKVSAALLEAAGALAGAAVLAAGARGLLRQRPASRSPVVVLQIIALPVAYSLGIQAHRIAYGGPILVAAIAVLYLLFTPPARAALAREPPA
ncbi:MAG: hypothetical protein ACTHMS_17775 [Jatrophihabitans sp.]|uniref:hypothetical protein n=1 Tax=Jatrophihabitans sp. TaxID=1932789 RepID=UPI003F7D6E04